MSTQDPSSAPSCPAEPKREGLFAQAWLVLLLAMCFGGSLAAVETLLKPIIEENKRAEIFDQIPKLVKGADSKTSSEHRPGVYTANDSEGKQVGWVLRASGQGFADRIECLIAVEQDLSAILGIYVLAQKETPGLGDYITDRERFRKWFEGQPTSTALTVSKRVPTPGQSQILSLTGATISSQAVADIVNKRVSAFKTELAKASGSQEESR